MCRLVLAVALAGLLAGCQARPHTPSAATPHAIAITNQSVVYTCASCGMDYDGPGVCPMDGGTLVKTAVSYECPADGKPVEHAGKCPRCDADARILRTAIAADGAPTGVKAGAAPSTTPTGEGS